LAFLARAIKDPALVPVLEQLARDPEFEVRRAAALALAEGPLKPRAPPPTATAVWRCSSLALGCKFARDHRRDAGDFQLRRSAIRYSVARPA